ncbi:MAG: DUF5916 domain-containing protein [Bacteroidales bacterium]
MIKKIFAILIILSAGLLVTAQEKEAPRLTVRQVSDNIKIDGDLSDNEWMMADSISRFRAIEPVEGSEPAFPTTVRVLFSQKNIYIGITCYDTEPGRIVSYSKARDSELEDEDNVKIIFDTYADGRNGYIFSVNPFACRFDAIVSNNGESENSNWDAIWEARTMVNEGSWSVEIKIPVSSLTFKKNLDHWGFNVERKVQRLMEVSRWTALSRDYKFGQTIHAGSLVNLPELNLGLGLTPTVSTIGKVSGNRDNQTEYSWQNSLDVMKKITPDITAQLTVNTDFAETEVDSRQTNLTRFPQLYPEKRQFFLEGSDIYDFGLGLNRDFIPFFSRRIGLNEGSEVPVKWGAKVNGKLNNTHFGVLVNETREVESLLPSTTTGVIRIKQNILAESSLGLLHLPATRQAGQTAWMSGVDFTYKTSRFNHNKNFLVGIWGLYNDRHDLEGDKSAFGIRVDYPNDLWEIAAVYRRIGDAFDPSLGFVPRNGINYYSFSANHMPRPDNRFIRKYIFESRLSLYTDLENNWESYDIFTAPVHFLMESGDRFEFNFRPVGESLKEPFEISDGVIIDPGDYNWTRWRLEVETASKRSVSGQATWWFGGFYGGRLDQIEVEIKWRPLSSVILELNYERNTGSLPAGDFVQDLFATRIQVNMTSNLNFSSYIQYDNESREMGSYSRLRWTFTPRGDVFLVYKHNITREITDRWAYDSNQFIIKVSYGLWL